MTLPKHVLLILIVLFCLACLILCGCDDSTGDGGGEPPNDECTTFELEYDFVENCDLFPRTDSFHSYDYAMTPFYFASTLFEPECPYPESFDLEDPGSMYDTDDVDEFVMENAECDVGSGLLLRLHKCAYLAGVPDCDNSDVLGITRGDGVQSKARSLVFVENIDAWASVDSCDPINLMKAVTVHELGHARGNLQHLCEKPEQHISPSNTHTCIMSDVFEWASCVDRTWDESPLDNIGFCDSCIANLSEVEW